MPKARGSSCSTVVEHTPHDPGVMSFNPAECLAFLSSHTLRVVSLKSRSIRAELLIFHAKKCMYSFATDVIFRLRGEMCDESAGTPTRYCYSKAIIQDLSLGMVQNDKKVRSSSGC